LVAQNLVRQNLVRQNLVRQNLVPTDFPNFDVDDDDNNNEEEHVESLRLGKAADAADLVGRSFLLLRFPSSFGPSSPFTSPISTTTTTMARTIAT
jgi:hypothetical protein